MYIKISDELKELAEIFERNGEDLYIVGGHVRDAILGVKGILKNDIDLCSACKPNKVVKILKNTKFEVDDKNAQFGTTIIYGNKRYEHTTFRRENYNLNGEHNPTGVEFIKDINQDARRRDFTINAVYYHINSGNIIDPVEGVKDINMGIIRTPINSNQSFKEDAERILRMIRFACTFNFLIDEKTLESALQFSSGVQNLSKTRMRLELEKMMYCDTFYPTRKESNFAHARCMILLGKLDLWQYILPALSEIQHSEMKDEKGELLYDHIIKTFSVCVPEVRLACLLHDVGKMHTKQNRNNFDFSQEWSDIIIEKNLGETGLGYSKKIVEETKDIVSALDFDRYGYKTKKQIRFFIRQYNNVFEKICLLKDAIALENTHFTNKSKIAAKWKIVHQEMQTYQTPLSLKELCIDGNDIIECVPEIRLELIGELLNKLLDFCLQHPRCNEKEILVQKVKEIVKKYPNKYFE